jgi:NaMN:DMB phosphoribosyltransferase
MLMGSSVKSSLSALGLMNSFQHPSNAMLVAGGTEIAAAVVAVVAVVAVGPADIVGTLLKPNDHKLNLPPAPQN